MLLADAERHRICLFANELLERRILIESDEAGEMEEKWLMKTKEQWSSRQLC